MVDDSAIVCHCAAKKHWDLLNRKKQGATSSQTSSAIIFSGKMAHFWGCSILKQTQIRQIPFLFWNGHRKGRPPCFVARFARPKLPQLLWRTAREIPRKKNDLHHDGLSATLCGVYICDLFAVFFWVICSNPQKQKPNLSLLNILIFLIGFYLFLPFLGLTSVWFWYLWTLSESANGLSCSSVQWTSSPRVIIMFLFFCSPDFQTIISCCWYLLILPPINTPLPTISCWLNLLFESSSRCYPSDTASMKYPISVGVEFEP